MSQGYPQPSMPVSQGNGMAVAALVVGLIGLLLAVATGWIPCVGLFIPLIPTALAVIFGFVGRSKASQGAPHGGLATAGLACGLLGLVFTIGFQVVWGLAFRTAVLEAGGIEGIQKGLEDAAKEAGKEFEAEMKKMQEEMEKEQQKFEIQIDEGKKPEAGKPEPEKAAPSEEPGKSPPAEGKETPPESAKNASP